MEIIFSDYFERELKKFKSKHSNQSNLIDKRLIYVASILSNRSYETALNTRYFDKCEGSEFIHEVRAKNKGLNFRFLCALFDKGKTCVFFIVFCENNSSDYKHAIEQAENRAYRWCHKNEKIIWRGR